MNKILVEVSIGELLDKISILEIKQEKIKDSEGNFVGVYLTKTNNDPGNSDKTDNEIDAISGATITGDGVSDMIIERVENYLPYFNSLNNE